MKKNKGILSKLIIIFVVLFKFLLNYQISETFLMKLLPVVTVLCILGIIIKNKFTKSQILRTFFITIPLLIISLIIKSPNFLFPVLIAIVSLDTDFKIIAKTFGYSILFFTIITILLNRLNILPSNDILRYIDGIYKTRYSLGFIHPNALMGAIVCAIFCFIYAYDFPKKFNIIFLILGSVFYYVTYSRTSFIMLLIVYILYVVKKKFPKYNFKIAAYFDVICFFILVFSAVLYSKCDIEALDLLFSNRLSINYLFMKNGYLFEFLPNMNLLENAVIDSYHFNIIIRFGFVGFILYMLYNIKTFKLLSADKNIMIICIAFAIAGLTEDIAMISSFNVIMTFQMIAYINSNRFLMTGDEI
ncbi:MAG: hypothetical protein E7158_03505 [Firmicutes bacterium]|nr:hypothetical protein [Bacillota bacterium]